MYLELYKAYTANFSKKRKISKLTSFMVSIHLKYLRLELMGYSVVVAQWVLIPSVQVRFLVPQPFVKETHSKYL